MRELALAQALDKRYNTIVVAMRKAAQQEEREKERAEKGGWGNISYCFNYEKHQKPITA